MSGPARVDTVPGLSGWPGYSPSPLVGRERELAALRDLLAAREGAVVLDGEAGVGKSALLAVAAAMADETAGAAGGRVEATCCVPGDAERPWSGLSGLLGPLSQDFEIANETLRRALATALGPDDPAGPGFSGGADALAAGERPDRLVVANAVLALVRAAGSAGPVLLVLDNAHLLDEASAQILAFAGRRLAGSQTILLAATRPQPTGPLAGGALPRLGVAALTSAAAGALLDQRFPALGGAARARVVVAAQGNPLALLELPLGLRAAGQGASAGVRGDLFPDLRPDVLPLSERLRDSLVTTIETLPAATRACLVLAALDDSPDLATVRLAWLVFSGGPGGPLPLAPAENLGLISVDEGRGELRFSDPLLRSALVQALPAVRLRAAHRALAAATSGQPIRHARHLAACADGPDEQIAELLEQVSRALERAGEAPAAVAALVRASEISAADGDRARRLLLAAHLQVARVAGTALARRLLAAAEQAEPGPWSGRPLQTLHGYVSRHPDPRDPHQPAGPNALLAACILAGIEVREAVKAPREIHTRLAAVVERCSRRASEDGPDAERPGRLDAADPAVLSALHLLIHTAALDGRLELWAEVCELAAGLSPRVPESLAMLLAAHSGDGPRMAAAASELGIQLGRAHAGLGEIRIEHVMGAALAFDRTPEARPALEHFAARARAAKALPSLLSALTALAQDAFVSGRWDECLEIVAEGLATSAEHGHSFAPLGFRGPQLMVAAGRGDQARVAALGGEVLDWALPRRAGHLVWPVRQAQALLASARGDAETVWATLAPLSPLTADLDVTLRVRWCKWAPDLVDAALRTGRPGEAAELVRLMREEGAALVSSRLELLVGVAQAQVIGDPDEAAAAFSAATGTPGAERWPFDLARARLWQAEFLRAHGRPHRVRPLLEAARETFVALGATPWVNRCGPAAGRSDPPSAGPGAGDPVGPGGSPALTPDERETVLLAAQGLSNKQIASRLMVSPRTVAGRLYRAFPKLGIRTRAGLRDVMGDHAP